MTASLTGRVSIAAGEDVGGDELDGELVAGSLIECPAAEAAVLGAAMLAAAAEGAARVLDGLAVDDFASGKHQAVFACIRRLIEAGRPVDPVTVLGDFRAHGELPLRNSPLVGVWLVELVEAVPTVAAAGHYRRIVVQHTYRRRIAQAAQRLAQHAADAPLEQLAELVAREAAAIDAAARRADLGDW